MIDGITVRMGGRDLVVPPLNFKQLKALEPVFKSIGTIAGALTIEQIDGCITVVHTALSRNYPELSKENVEEMVDLGNLETVMFAIRGASGLVGERKPGNQSTGTSSTPNS